MFFHSLDSSKTTVLQILRSILRKFLYGFQHLQALEPGDNQQHVKFANYVLNRYDENSSWPLPILFMDAAHLTLTGNVHSKNCVHLVEEKSS